MAEAILMAVTKSVIEKLASFTADLALTSATEEIRAAKAAKKDLKTMASKLSAICALLEDAERRQYANESIKIWLRDLKDVVYDINHLIDEVSTYALQRTANEGNLLIQLRYYFSTNPVIFRFELSNKVKGLRKKLDDIVAKKNDFGLTEHPVEITPVERNPLDKCAYVNMSDIIGRDEARQDVVNILSAIGGARNHPSVLPIVGLGGVGKTALAKLVYHDDWVVRAFDIKLWACISHTFDIQKIMEDIIKSAVDDNLSNLGLGRVVEKLRDLLRGKKYFLVLDDIWLHDIALWTEFKNMLAVGDDESVILVTTRHANVASVIGTEKPYDLAGLSDHYSWSIFEQLAFMEGDEHRYPDLVQIGRSIVKKCVGVPLLVKTLASFLRNERNKSEWLQVDRKSNLVEVQTQCTNVMRVLKLSYDKLPSHLKPCFAYCSLFVKTAGVYPRLLSKYWSALGLLQLSDRNSNEGIGYNYFTELLSRSLLQEPWVFFDGAVFYCQMHDLLHDLATNIVGEELAVVTCNELKVSEMCRHIVWGYEARDELLDKKFPKDLVKARKVLTFRFGYKMGQISKSFLRGLITSLERLRILDLGNSYFEELPKIIGNLKHLRYLDLGNNYMLKKIPSTICQLLNLQTLNLYGCKQLKELPKDMNKLLSLRDLTVTTNQMCLADSKINGLSSLQRLVLYSCKELTSLWDGGVASGSLTSLRELEIKSCSRLTSLPNSMKCLVFLERLVISYCQELDLEVGEGLNGLKNLQILEIVGVPKLVSLPDGLQSAATSLLSLSIGCCISSTQLPNWLQDFIHLRRLHIYDCPNLLALPKGFRHLHSLETLRIRNCSHLTTRCAKPYGEDFSNIQHIREFFLDHQLVT